MRTLIAIMAMLALSSFALAENKFNPMTGDYEVVPEDYQLRYNAPAGTWTYAPPTAQLELNRSTMEFQYPGQGSHQPPSMGRPEEFIPQEYRDYQQRERDTMPCLGIYGC